MRLRHDPDLSRQHLAERKAEHRTFAQLTELSLDWEEARNARVRVKITVSGAEPLGKETKNEVKVIIIHNLDLPRLRHPSHLGRAQYSRK
jgi:hypothetical protein